MPKEGSERAAMSIKFKAGETLAERMERYTDEVYAIGQTPCGGGYAEIAKAYFKKHPKELKE